jgi:hypothetical protein
LAACLLFFNYTIAAEFNRMKAFEPFDGVIEIFTFGKTILLKSKIPIPRCWIKVSDPTGKIVFKKIENDLTEKTIVFNLKSGLYDITIVTEKNFTSSKVFLE